MVMEDAEAKIKEFHPKIVYVVPTFQNPTGKTLPVDRRKKLAELGSRYDVIILEDDPYRDIRYSGTDLPPIKTFDQTGNTVLANSFSKIFSPGARLGYVLATKELISLFYQVQTATVSHTSMLPQVLCAEFFNRGYYPEHLKKICRIHGERCSKMLECLDRYFPEGSRHTVPDGGLFTWVELPGGLNTKELLPEAVQRKVAYVAGEGFYTSPGMGTSAMRLSFSAVPPDKIEIGIKRLGDLFCSRL
jgi:2-aminoadipate transaminase